MVCILIRLLCSVLIENRRALFISDDAQDGDTRLYEVEKAVDACVAALKAFIVS